MCRPAARTATVNIVPRERGKGKPGFPIPSPDGRVWERAALTQGYRKTGFPHPSPDGRVWEGVALTQGEGETGFPYPPTRGRVWERAALTQGEGETGFPLPSPDGRVWEGVALTQGEGETGFPLPSPDGRVWEGYALPGRTFFHPVGVRRSRMERAGQAPRATLRVALRPVPGWAGAIGLTGARSPSTRQSTDRGAARSGRAPGWPARKAVRRSGQTHRATAPGGSRGTQTSGVECRPGTPAGA